MKIQYCPICMAELVDIGIMTFACPYCKVCFYISIEHKTDTSKPKDNDNG